jgi:Inositol monophosphatase family
VSVLGEEGGGRASDRHWLVDPLDGTMSFIHGFWAVALKAEPPQRLRPRAVVPYRVRRCRGALYSSFAAGASAGAPPSMASACSRVRPVSDGSSDVPSSTASRSSR